MSKVRILVKLMKTGSCGCGSLLENYHFINSHPFIAVNDING
jgi:hypothetical protein